MSSGNSDRNIAYLKRTNVHMYLFLQAKENRTLRVIIFANGKFLKISCLQISDSKKKEYKKDS